MRLKLAGLTDVGRSRTNNEDAIFLGANAPLAVVADGMGGHNAGEVASAIAIQTFRAIYEQECEDAQILSLVQGERPEWPLRWRKPEGPDELRMMEATLLANEAIYRHASADASREGMGTTLVGGYFLGGGLYVAHVGDSRAYRLREGRLERITRDHSLADEYSRMGLLSNEDLRSFPYRNVITRALGLLPRVLPDIRFWPVRAGDLYLFCSDGLTDPLRDETIEAICLRHRGALERCCTALVDAANSAGGPDNITVALARVEAGARWRAARRQHEAAFYDGEGTHSLPCAPGVAC